MGGRVVRPGWAWFVAGVLAVSACSAARGPSTTVGETSGGSTVSRPSVSTRHHSGGKDPAPLGVGETAWISVSVATLWRSPDSPRPVDAPALRNPAEVQRWLDAMTLDQRRALSGRADTQALLGDRVMVVALPSRRPAWARVVVPSQPAPLDSAGYPGWVPRRQLTATRPSASRLRATVLSPTAWLRTDVPSPSGTRPRLFRVSMGTTLPVVNATERYVRVVTPSGDVRRLARRVVALHYKGRAAVLPSRRSLVTTAKQFLGLPYLWAGASGFGLDCSGLTWLVYRVHGIRIPRDAAPQSMHGTPVGTPRRGDLMFYAIGGVVHHVSMYVGNGRMIHSPGTGQSVTIVPVSASPYSAQYAGSRRNLP